MDLARAVEVADQRLREALMGEKVPGIEFGLIHHGVLAHHAVLGAAPPGRQFRIASMTKSFTAATVLSLRDAGLLRLDDPVADYLPRLRVVGIPADSPALRVRHLLTMTAGFPTDDPWGDRQEGLPLDEFDHLAAAGLSACRVPGLDFEYSNLGYALLGRVITAITGRPYVEVVAEAILHPLGMSKTTYDVRDTRDRAMGWHPRAAGLVEQREPTPGAFSPMGGLWSTVPDLARWVNFLEAAWRDGVGGEIDVPAPVARWSRREMQSPQTFARLETGPAGCTAQSYGMGLYVAEIADLGRFIHHSGGYPGFGSHMRWHPATGWGIVALANRTYAPMGKVCGEVLSDIVAAERADARASSDPADLWPQTQAAIDLAESLLSEWDDSSLDAIAAMNLDMDQPRDERREQWEELAALGPFVQGSLASDSPAHARRVMVGAHGDLRIDVLMSPESPPRMQALRIEKIDQ